MNLYKMRRRRNAAAMVLSLGATVFGLGWLVLILAVLLWKGIAGLNVQVFTEMTPPPGSAGGLLNPIIGSLIFTTLAVLTGTPIGILGMAAGAPSPVSPNAKDPAVLTFDDSLRMP